MRAAPLPKHGLIAGENRASMLVGHAEMDSASYGVCGYGLPQGGVHGSRATTEGKRGGRILQLRPQAGEKVWEDKGGEKGCRRRVVTGLNAGAKRSDSQPVCYHIIHSILYRVFHCSMSVAASF